MTEDLFQQAQGDFLQAKARAEETAAAIRRAHADDAEAQEELARMQNVLDWFEQRRPQKHDEPEERTATSVPATPELIPSEPARAMNLSDRTATSVPAPPELIPSEPARVKKQAKNLSDLVHDAVEQLGGSARNPEILEHLQGDGYDFTALQVRGSAKHLAKTGRLVSGGYGIWSLPPMPSSHNSPAVVDGPAMNGAGGSL